MNFPGMGAGQQEQAAVCRRRGNEWKEPPPVLWALGYGMFSPERAERMEPGGRR